MVNNIAQYVSPLDSVICDPRGNAYPDEIEMQVQQSKKLQGAPGQNIPMEFEPLTVRGAIVNALTRNWQDEQDKLVPEEKARRGRICVKFMEQQEPDLWDAEVEVAKERVAKLYTPLIVWRTWEVLSTLAKSKEIAVAK